MKILIIKYLPKKENSNTGRLLDCFKSLIKPEHTVEELNLLKNIPPFFDQFSINAYIQRDYLNQKLPEKDINYLQKFDVLSNQFKSADIIVIAFPMHNFSFPGLVKLYFDAVMLKNKTWTIDSEGYKGLMTDKKAVVLSSSGGSYMSNNNPWNHLTTLAETELKFLGFSDIKIILAENMNMGKELQEESLNKSFEKIKHYFNGNI